MGYIAVQGGTRAIEAAERLSRYLRLKGGSAPLKVRQILDQMGLLVDRVMSEGGLYAPFHAALALKQTQGDPSEAAFHLRAYRSTLPRLADSAPIDTSRMRIERRISSAFKEIPGGQILGATPDYTQRILDFSLLDEDTASAFAFCSQFAEETAQGSDEIDGVAFTKVVDILRAQGLVPEPVSGGTEPAVDVTTQSVTYPLDRSGRLQMLARSETGGALALAYSSMRGYGSIHPTIGELRVGWVRVELRHPFRPAETIVIGSIRVTEVEIVASVARGEGQDAKPTFTLGYGVCFGRNELKAISLAVLDRTMKSGCADSPAQDQEFVLYHTDGIESSGFCSHFKLPHYITFQSALDRLRESQKRSEDPALVSRGSGLTGGADTDE